METAKSLCLRGTQTAFAERRREEREMKRRMWLMTSIALSLGGKQRGETKEDTLKNGANNVLLGESKEDTLRNGANDGWDVGF